MSRFSHKYFLIFSIYIFLNFVNFVIFSIFFLNFIYLDVSARMVGRDCTAPNEKLIV